MSLRHPAGVPAKMPFSVRLTKKRQEIRGTPAGRPLFVRWVSQGHPAGLHALSFREHKKITKLIPTQFQFGNSSTQITEHNS